MAIVGSILLLLEMFLEVSASYSYRGAWYQPIEHYALLGQSFMNISGISAVRCSAQCIRNSGCFSFNYDRINRVCQMNGDPEGINCSHFQDLLSFSYYDANADTMTCQISLDGKCTPLKDCWGFDKLGLEDGSIPDESLSASSSYDLIRTSTPAGGRLNKLPPDDDTIGAWHAKVKDTNQWIQVDLGNPTYVTGVLTQGRTGGNAQWVTKYKVQFEPPSPACLFEVRDKTGHTQIFNGNFDRDSIVERRFFKPVLAVKIRIVPVEWYAVICLRFELLGCK
ncbi:retinoschisin-like isoform X1 [Asterias rubens]|uniref:retinoschisin-like isoform X1 n=1 Tax=Asterias rubens TaxID=7604 RepID=UPI00145572FC|nr:retinoschisin-like isoform X1 [Asterias rubens]